MTIERDLIERPAVAARAEAVSLAEMASRINEEHQRCEGAQQEAVAHALAAGDLLLKAKERVEHGQWLAWLEQFCSFSRRTAQVYLRMAKRYPFLGAAKAQRVALLPLRDAVKALAEEEPAEPEPNPEAPTAADSGREEVVANVWPELRPGHWYEGEAIDPDGVEVHYHVGPSVNHLGYWHFAFLLGRPGQHYAIYNGRAVLTAAAPYMFRRQALTPKAYREHVVFDGYRPLALELDDEDRAERTGRRHWLPADECA